MFPSCPPRGSPGERRFTLPEGRSRGKASGEVLQAGSWRMATSYPGKHLHPVWRCERESLLLTHRTWWGEAGAARLLRVRVWGPVGEGKASQWTLRGGSPHRQKSGGVSSRAEPTHVAQWSSPWRRKMAPGGAWLTQPSPTPSSHSLISPSSL